MNKIIDILVQEMDDIDRIPVRKGEKLKLLSDETAKNL